MSSVPTPGGLVLAPFRGLRYVTGDLAVLSSPPYDVLDDDGVRRLEQLSPRNVVRLILPRDDADGPGSRYRRAATELAHWRGEGILAADPSPRLYVYEESTGAHTQRGLLGAVALSPTEAGIVLPHENTMAGPVADRLALTEATQANLEPIFLLYAGGGAASAVVAGAGQAEPLAEGSTDDGVSHRLWAVTDPDQLDAVATDLLPRRAVIADGHHRYATYLRHQADRHALGDGGGPWDHGLAYLVDSTAFGPQVHAIHRVVPSLAVSEAARRAAAGFAVRRLDRSVPAALSALATAGKAGPAFLLAGGDERYLVTEPVAERLHQVVPADRSAAWLGLDVTVAHRLLIAELWGLADSEQVVEFRHDVPGALDAATATGGTALLLNPTPVDQVAAVAAAGERMPRKSTLFTPKPRSGLVMRAFADG